MLFNERIRNYFLIIVLICVCIIFNLIILKHYFHKELNPDEKIYYGIAQALINKSNYAKVGQHIIDIGQEVTPFYSTLVALAYLIYPSIWSLILLQFILNCFTIVFVFLTLIRIIKNKIINLIFTLLFIFYYPLWAYNYYIMMEVPTVFFLTVSIYLIGEFLHKKQIKFLYLALITFSLLILINNRFVVLLFFMVVYIGYLTFGKNLLKFKHYLIVLLIPILIISPWFIRQYYTYKRFVFFTPLWNNVVAEKIGLFKRIEIKSIEEYYEKTEPMKYEQYLNFLKENNLYSEIKKEEYEKMILNANKCNIYLARLKRYFKLYDRKLGFMYGEGQKPVLPASLPKRIVQIFILLPFFIFSFIGIIYGLLKNKEFIVLLSLFYFAHIFIHVLIHFIDRYRLTILPVLVILGTYGLFELINQVKIVLNRIYIK